MVDSYGILKDNTERKSAYPLPTCIHDKILQNCDKNEQIHRDKNVQ